MNLKEAKLIIDKYSKSYSVSLPSPDKYLKASGYLEASTKYRKVMDELAVAIGEFLDDHDEYKRAKRALLLYKKFIEDEYE